jgi:lipopolysaccharide transport system permease protein
MRQYLEFVLHRSLAELRGEFSRVFLGTFWWLAEPVLYMAVFYVIFGLIFQQRGENYASFLLTGLVFWKWFASAINSSATVIKRNMPLIYQVYLPKWVFPCVAVLTSTFRFAIVFVVLIIFLLVVGQPVTIAWVTDLVPLMLVQLLLMLGLSMVLASIVPFVPDLKFLIDNGMLLLFFVSGIFFRFDSVPDSIRPYFDLNPIGVLIHNYRQVLINGEHVQWGDLFPLLLLTISFLVMGLLLLIRFDRVYAKRAFL